MDSRKDIFPDNFGYEPTIDNTDIGTDTDDRNSKNWYENGDRDWTIIKQEPQ